jgi:ABC-2 type transport system permease protein
MNATYVRSEIRRSFRTPRYLIFAFGMPLLMFFVFGRAYGHGTLGGISVPAYIMVSIATFGAMSAVFGTSGRIAMERAVGWNRQLRLTALSGRGYVSGKALAGFAVAVPSLAIVFAAGAAFHHVDLSAGRWAALAASILLALLPIAALGRLDRVRGEGGQPAGGVRRDLQPAVTVRRPVDPGPELPDLVGGRL